MWRVGLAAAAVGAVLGVAVLIDGRGYDRGRAEAEASARAATRELINDMANEADAARVRRRACIDAGGLVYKGAFDEIGRAHV